jgi:uncharacterized membrane protein
MAKIFTVLFFGLACEAVGVVFLSKGLKELGDVPKNSMAELLAVVGLGITNKRILIGVFFEALLFGSLLYLLSQRDVSFIWPLTSLSFAVTAVAAKFFLHEQIPSARWAGICLIIAGAALVTWREQSKVAKMEEEIAQAGQ